MQERYTHFVCIEDKEEVGSLGRGGWQAGGGGGGLRALRGSLYQIMFDREGRPSSYALPIVLPNRDCNKLVWRKWSTVLAVSVVYRGGGEGGTEQVQGKRKEYG